MGTKDLRVGPSDLDQLRLLVVTADESLFARVRRALASKQTVQCASDMDDALRLVGGVDALVLDCHHPASLTVCKRIREDEQLARLIVIAVVDQTDMHAREAALGAGVDELLSRPFDDLELGFRLRSVQRIARKHRHRTTARELALFKAAIDQCSDAIHVIDPPTGRFLCVNTTAHERLGYTYDEYVGMRASDVEAELPTDAQWLGHVEELKAAGELTFAGVHRRRDGTTFPVEVNVRYITAEPKDYMIAISRDVTERRAAETALRLTQFAVDRAVDSIFWVGPNAEILYVNDKACELLGYSREELLRSTVHDIDPNFPKEVWPAHWEELKRRGSFSFESLHMRKSGPPIHTETTVNYLQYRGQEYNCAIMRDIGDRKRADEALRDSLREKDLLIDEVHHRVKNSLQIVSSLLRLELTRRDHPETKTAMRDMQSRIQSMALLHELLYRNSGFDAVDLDRYLGQLATQLFRAHGRSPDVELDLRLAPVTVAIQQAMPCGLAVHELITNSLKHAFPAARKGTVRLELSDDAKQRRTRVRVSDDGRGLPGDYHIRRDGALGLQLVTDLAQQLKGQLVVTQERSLAFELSFPASEAQQ